VWPRRHSALFRSYGAESLYSGILLFGPPGTGKTMIPREKSRAWGFSLVNMKLSEVVKGELGASEAAIQSVFSRAMQVCP
jgi:ribosome biogenesis ATPase